MIPASCHPLVADVAWLAVDERTQVGRVRRVVTALADQLGFSATRAAEVGIAVTEIGSNLHKHAKEGVVLVRSVRESVTEVAVEVVAIDSGPGIGDLALARQDGQSTSGTLGVGLGAVIRLSNACSMSSQPGRGTVQVARFHRQGAARPAPHSDVAAGLTRAIRDELVCGDAYAVCRAPGRLTLMMCDGSGHGHLAAVASAAAVRVFHERPDLPPEELVRRFHAALRGTRGGAVAVAAIDLETRAVRFAGLGNIAAAVLSPGRKQGMISVPGVAGHQARTIRSFDYAVPDNGVVVLHSDGLTERWDVKQCGDVAAEPPVLVAATLLREAGVRKDDACVLVGRPG